MRWPRIAALKPALAWASPRVLEAGLAVRAGMIHVLSASDPPPAWRGKWRRRFAYATVGSAVAVLGTGALVGFYGRLGVAVNVGAALIVTAVGTLIRYPLMSWRLAWLALMFSVAFGSPLLTVRPWHALVLPVLAVAFWCAGMRHGHREIWWMWALTVPPLWLWIGGTSDTDRVGGLLAFTAVAVAVDSLSSRKRTQRHLAEQAELTELEQARRAVLTERARIARELHDVVAHHMSLIAVRAETAPYRLTEVDDPVRTEFLALSSAAREALTDMRRLLGVLRDDGPAGRAPQPEFADLPALVASARIAGVAVDLSLPADLTGVPAAVGVCAYRIVQESLSNAGRHAPGATVSVTVTRDDAAVSLRVANGPGSAAPRRPDDGHGHGQGLAGMRERVALLDGELSAGPQPGGGFIVEARLPLGAPADISMAGQSA